MKVLRTPEAAFADLPDYPFAAHYVEVNTQGTLICPLLGGPKSMLFWTRKGKKNAIQETHAGGNYRQAA
jgi:hypothetical protein